MKTILDKMRRVGVGTRPLGEKDFYRICERENILILSSKEKFAFCITEEGNNAIVLPERSRGLKLLRSMYHELTHVLCHAGEVPEKMYEGRYADKNEIEADAIALIALIPLSHIGRVDFLDGSRIAKQIYNERLRLYFIYGI